MVDRSTKALIGLCIAASVVSLLAGVLVFLQTRDLASSLLFGAGLPALFATLAVLAWMAEDADQVGVPRLPWMVAAVLAPGIGLVGYLVARELARRGPTSPIAADDTEGRPD